MDTSFIEDYVVVSEGMGNYEQTYSIPLIEALENFLLIREDGKDYYILKWLELHAEAYDIYQRLFITFLLVVLGKVSYLNPRLQIFILTGGKDGWFERGDGTQVLVS
jgi:hypothetical protein